MTSLPLNPIAFPHSLFSTLLSLSLPSPSAPSLSSLHPPLSHPSFLPPPPSFSLFLHYDDHFCFEDRRSMSWWWRSGEFTILPLSFPLSKLALKVRDRRSAALEDWTSRSQWWISSMTRTLHCHQQSLPIVFCSSHSEANLDLRPPWSISFRNLGLANSTIAAITPRDLYRRCILHAPCDFRCHHCDLHSSHDLGLFLDRWNHVLLFFNIILK